MLHVRAVSPASLRPEVVSRLVSARGVANIVVQPAAARRPDGDAISFDVHDDDANPVLGELRELGLDRDGAITIVHLDAALSSSAWLPPGSSPAPTTRPASTCFSCSPG